MTCAELMEHLRSLDVELSLDGESLRLNAPRGALSEELQAELRGRREELIEFLALAREDRSRSSLVPLRDGSSRPALFAVPGHNGDVFCFMPIAKASSDKQPIFAFQPPGLDGREEPLDRVEELAASFVDEVRRQQASGPYHLCGYCTGGLVAFEAAQQLRRAGEPIALLVLFGTPCPTSYSALHQASTPAVRAVNRVARFVRERRQPPPEASSVTVQGSPGTQTGDGEDSEHRYRALIEKATQAAVRKYSPERWPGRLWLYIPSENRRAAYCERYYDWADLCEELCVRAGPPECIHSRMLREPYAQGVAEHLDGILCEAYDERGLP